MLMRDKPVIGFAGYSGTGKTTLLTQLVPALIERNIRAGLVKHAHHSFDIDHVGKDSYELRKVGASPVLVASKSRWALIVENNAPELEEPELQTLIDRVISFDIDLVIVEGFKHEPIAKIEVLRPALGKPLLYPTDNSFVAIASDDGAPVATDLPVLDLNNVDAIADFVADYVARHSNDT